MKYRNLSLAASVVILAFSQRAKADQTIDCTTQISAMRLTIKTTEGSSNIVVDGINPGEGRIIFTKGVPDGARCAVAYGMLNPMRFICLPSELPLSVSTFDTWYSFDAGTPDEPDMDSGLRSWPFKCTVRN